jgi:hypothetical protein
MTFDEIKNLKVDDVVTYVPDATKPDKKIQAKVIQNGPRVDDKGESIAWMNDLLVVQIGDGPAQISWEPVSWPEGIPNLLLAKK